jgi:hypothetical protein
MKAHCLFFLGLLLMASVVATAQYDSSYYVSYEDQITSRFYF